MNYFTFALLLVIHLNSWAYIPYNELQVSHVSLKYYPDLITPQQPEVEVTIGDLHGNALKLVNFLIRNDVLKMSQTDYLEFVSIYTKTVSELTAKDLAIFESIINSAVINPQHRIRFLGDDLCDRGMNDYYTLSIYKKLDEAELPFDIVLSNHGNFFLSAYERPEQSFSYNPYGEGKYVGTVRSMLNMGELIDKGLIDKKEVIEIVQKHYLKHLVLPGYTYNKIKNEFTIYSHAPIDLSLLSALANDLNLEFNDSNSNELSHSLDAINALIQQWIMNRQFTSHYESLNKVHEKLSTPSPIMQVLWNRDYSILKRQHKPQNKAYTVNYVHGHDSMPNVFDLDNLFGKKPGEFEGPYAIHLTHA